MVAAVAVAAMLVVRRRAPEGSYFADGDRAAGIFGVLATGFSVLLGFLIFLGFESYDALAYGRRDRSAHRGPADPDGPAPAGRCRPTLTGELVCYARSVIHGEWERMEDGTLGEDINRWGVALFATMHGVELSSPVEEAAYGSGSTRPRRGSRPARTASMAPPG